MKSGVKFGCIWLPLGLIALLLVWFFSAWDTETLHYKLTYEVETPNGVASGSSVIKVRWEDMTKLPVPGRGLGNEVTGEAAVVDLGAGKYLFSLLKGTKRGNTKSEPDGIPLSGFDPDRKWLTHNGVKYHTMDFIRHLDDVMPKADLSFDDLPMLVTFDDISDPTSVKQVDPNNLAGTFGEGYALKSITLEITDEPVTSGKVESVLGAQFFRNWAANHKAALKRSLNDHYFKTLSSELNRNLFLRKPK